MRFLAPLASIVLAAAAVAAQQTAPQFRAGTELVAVDFQVIDEAGRPVTDLKPGELTLKVDGRTRDIRALQFVKVAATSTESPGPVTSLPLPFATNDAISPGRIIIIVIDHEQLRPGEGKAAIEAAGRLVDRLSAADRVGLVTLPNGRVEVDLTTNHERVRKALATIVGRAPRTSSIWNMSLWEAIAVDRERLDNDKPVTNELIGRECHGPGDSSCITQVVTEAMRLAREIDFRSRNSLRALEDFLNGVSHVEGPKTIVLLSGAFVRANVNDTPLDLDVVAKAAAAARAQFYVVQPHESMMDTQNRNSVATLTKDEELRREGLEDLAGVTGGVLFRLSGLGDTAFTRIADEVSAYYLLGFEPRSQERDGKRHKIELATKRQKVLIRARPGFIIDELDRFAEPLGPPAMLRDFAVHRDLQLRAAAFPFRNTDKERIKVVVALEPADPAATLTSAAFALINVNGQIVAEWNEDGAGVVLRPLVTAAVVPPGDYRLRAAAVDATGRRGAVDYEFTAALSSADPLKLGTLMAGIADRGNFRPRLQFAATSTGVTGYLEIYGTPPPGGTIAAAFDLSVAPDGPALASGAANVLMSSDPDRLVATGEIPLAGVAPGDYVLRGIVKLDGRVAGQATRTIRVLRAGS
ncbi:MAG: VWA domain-containing protein [Acidobacteriota bacterium]